MNNTEIYILIKKKKKGFIVTFWIILSIIFLTSFFYKNKSFVKKHLWDHLPSRIQIITKLILNKDLVNNFKNDYNIKFLPETQFQKISLKKIDLEFLISKNLSSNYVATPNIRSFYIENFNTEKIWIINDQAKIFEIKNIDVKTKKKLTYTKKIKTNLKVKKVLDTLLIKDKIFISFIESDNNCNKFKIIFAINNNEILNFQEFFTTNQCGEWIQGGRMQHYFHNEKEGILFTTGDNVVDRPDAKSQNIKSIYGKTIFQSFKSNNHEIFSMGHRNPQGLLVKNKLILMTEHGPKGGDEINKIIYKKNYGWPIASYGKKYSIKESISYKKSHENNNFEEPIYAFVPSIGISELISLPNSFSDHWVDNFLVTSLYGRSIFRIKFNKNFDKVIFVEKIFIGERIRDIKYSKIHKMILVALEEKGQLGVLTVSN